MPRADFITSILLMALGIGAAVESWRMPRLQEMGVNPYSVPGLVPFLIGLVIAALGAILFVRAARAGGHALLRAAPGGGDPLVRQGVRRFLLAAALILGYALGLVGRLPFWLATAIFVAAFVLAFDWRPGLGRASQLGRTALIVAFGLVVGIAVSVVFSDLFLVRLP